MPYTLQRTDEELDEAMAASASRSQFHNLTYEEGIGHALAWALGLTEDHPLAQEEDDEQAEA